MEEFLFALEADGVHLDGPVDFVPLYCALVRFRRECTLSMIKIETRELIMRSPPILLESEKKEMVSWCKNVPVHFVRKTAALQRLHDIICADQLQRGAKTFQLEYIGNCKWEPLIFIPRSREDQRCYGFQNIVAGSIVRIFTSRLCEVCPQLLPEG